MPQQGFYGPISDDVWQRAQKIKLLICDVDGVFSDGRIYLSNSGEELKAFHTRDGYGVRSLLTSGFNLAVITGRQSKIVENRMTALGVTHIYQGVDNKFEPYEALLALYGVTPEEVAYIGDDIVDLPVMNVVGLAVSVADGHPYVRQHAHFVTTLNGGHGALRELTDLLLLSQNKFTSAHGMSI
ncbi:MULTISPECIES: 3-deoxy-manno-octulosonate-8-phosphatase KdsC [Shewanella]|jgi:3-deoxy-D-manno-octulosonate 8-phosphate phosphatase (KDO 8-P phosphatase)|uniref:3-deoxy-D-manno-octulosonate 8-phosphate phosphatase KdsC n=1 Tax=Shewanella oncorhynchi TaxID=2726434 RepID=A0AA50KEI7_9GAMM|nr:MULTISPECIES: 3-deoxy-manno-octulosonate-8-phosphatase KdsC [Shewanella]MBU1391344.1 3-deoxy-manno-octulosonate-8-phosphatase KdsC [Gammaproteobacteria bacterium]QYX65396.1 3-deoxy-manno-octulosonate-8-phosphatase KdsC [Shewanella putrefaciens]AUD59077.1 3-deoxy-D-manno-octulosonate 8-phosphate phosphatase [Shewanella sp. Pdp11]AVI66469.1 3-deoxy-manno-octulosonate-8-phosphatase KdsC [Shewanella sp. WE21]KZK70985.1 3-deoxy-D-manno-octulosonate 8-phosphate phosphatase [Shewanella baltica]